MIGGPAVMPGVPLRTPDDMPPVCWYCFRDLVLSPGPSLGSHPGTCKPCPQADRHAVHRARLTAYLREHR